MYHFSFVAVRRGFRLHGHESFFSLALNLKEEVFKASMRMRVVQESRITRSSIGQDCSCAFNTTIGRQFSWRNWMQTDTRQGILYPWDAGRDGPSRPTTDDGPAVHACAARQSRSYIQPLFAAGCRVNAVCTYTAGLPGGHTAELINHRHTVIFWYFAPAGRRRPRREARALQCAVRLHQS
jgi:hypothetical protein